MKELQQLFWYTKNEEDAFTYHHKLRNQRNVSLIGKNDPIRGQLRLSLGGILLYKSEKGDLVIQNL